MKRWLRRLRKLAKLLGLLRPAPTGSGRGGQRSTARQQPTEQIMPRSANKEYVTVGGRSFLLQRGPGGTTRIYDASGRPVGTARNRGEANEVIAELATESNRAENEAAVQASEVPASTEQPGADAVGGEA